MNIYIGSDHAGFDLKDQLYAWLLDSEHELQDLGNLEYDKNDDYPDMAHAVAKAVAGDANSRGILLCGNAEGVCIVANKTDGIRAGLGFSVEATTSARNDDDINIICLPGKLMELDEAKRVVTAFLETPFEGAERQVRRLKKIEEIEEDN